ncbi:MAG: hypothetical protein SCH98_16205 [Deferrisomatales bacterium]|nr:hypothetical protein [Deferrisomatales bacterium]
MGEAFLVFLAGSIGVFLGMGLLYATIRITAVAVERLTRKGES